MYHYILQSFSLDTIFRVCYDRQALLFNYILIRNKEILQMKFLKQFGIILVFSFIGELLNHVLPLPVPASIYGIILMFTCLKLGFFPLSEIEETGRFVYSSCCRTFRSMGYYSVSMDSVPCCYYFLYYICYGCLWHDYSIYDSLFRFKKSSVKKSFVCQGRGMWLWNFLTTLSFSGYC